MDEIPPVEQALRDKIGRDYQEKGIAWLQDQIKEKDPGFCKRGEMQNPQRLMRALEIVESTGKSILIFQKGNKVKRDFNIIKVGLELPKEELHRNINARVDKMIETGLIQEVQQLQHYRYLNALKSVGYSEIIDFLDSRISLSNATELIKKNTRQYAKRQMTWFKKDKEMEWFSPAAIERIKERLDDILLTYH